MVRGDGKRAAPGARQRFGVLACRSEAVLLSRLAWADGRGEPLARAGPARVSDRPPDWPMGGTRESISA